MRGQMKSCPSSDNWLIVAAVCSPTLKTIIETYLWSKVFVVDDKPSLANQIAKTYQTSIPRIESAPGKISIITPSTGGTVIKVDDRVVAILKQGVSCVVMAVCIYYGHKMIADFLKESLGLGVNKNVAKQVKQLLAKKLNKKEDEIADLNAYEMKMAANVIGWSELDVTFDDIGGMDNELDEIRDHVVIPMQHWQMLRDHSDILPCPTGVLLYGKPGTGKTMSAKAIAKASSILDKYLGESDKLAAAIFSLARKLAPTVIFIDEIDTLLKNRDAGSDGGNSHLSSIQGVFLSEWDGLQSESTTGAPVLVLGATNRIMDLDKAIQRRMPVTIQTREPDVTGRYDILKKTLRTETLNEDLDIQLLAEKTPGFTGSDIKELTRAAALHRVKSILSTKTASMKAMDGRGGGVTQSGSSSVATSANVPTSTSSTKLQSMSARDMIQRPLCMSDFEIALSKLLQARSDTAEYTETIHNQSRNASTNRSRKDSASSFETGLGIGLGMIHGSLLQI
eukprot:gene7749-15853_t